MANGIRTEFAGKTNTAVSWIRRGGTLEDSGTLWEMAIGKARFFRHFHNPLQPWDRAGLRYLLFPRSDSSVRWAQRDNQDSVTGYGNFSWLDARRYYLRALTGADPSVRERAFADTFQGLGQVMHLVVDASVPEHVRDDEHPMGAVWDKFGQVGNYEYWVLAQHPDRDSEQVFIRDFLSAPITLDPELLRIPIPSSEPIARVPIARLWDTDRYVGTNPEVTAEPRIGIAEIANANFLSEDTRRGQLPHPALANMQKYTGVYSKTGARRAYFRKPGAGLAVDPIATECGLEELTGFVDLCIDDDVWRETARQMLPRAVRYSQEVLDYFFRGKLDVDLIEDETDPSVFRLTGTNASSETLVDGTLTLYADDPTGIRSLAPSVEEIPVRDVAPEQELPVASFQAPENAERFVAVYQGTLGQEAKDPGKNFPGAVIGKVLGGVRVEEVFLDWTTWPDGTWKLRTPKGLFRLPIPSEFYEVRWGDTENTLVARSTSYGPEGWDQPPTEIRVVAYEIQRQPGSVEPVTNDTPDGPEVRLTPLAAATFPFGLDLGTTVDHTHTLSYRQQLLTYDMTYVWQWQRRENPWVTDDGFYYFADTIFGGIQAKTVAGREFRFPAIFRIVLDAAHYEAPSSTDCIELGRPCPDTVSYGWFLEDVAVDASGHLLALVKVSLTVPPEALRPRVSQPVYGLNHLGQQVVVESCPLYPCSPITVELSPSYPAAQAKPLMWALVDLTAGAVLASTAEASITITSNEAFEEPNWFSKRIPPDSFNRPVYGVYEHGTKLIEGGPSEGKYDTGWVSVPVYSSGEPPPGGVTLTRLTVLDEERLEVTGWLRPELRAALAPAGLLTPPPPPAPRMAWSESLVLGLQVTGSGSLGSSWLPPQLQSARRARPAPGGERLVFLAAGGMDEAGHGVDAILVWDLRTARAEMRHRLPWGNELGPATRDTVLVQAGWGSQGLLIPLEGPAGPTLFPDPLWNFTLLDPHYLYNVETGKFYRLKPPLQPTALPAKLADLPPWTPRGDYHAIRLP